MSKADPLVPSAALLVKLGSIVVHAEEMKSYNFDPRVHGFVHDAAALQSLFDDQEVIQWRKAMDKLGFLPVKR